MGKAIALCPIDHTISRWKRLSSEHQLTKPSMDEIIYNLTKCIISSFSLRKLIHHRNTSGYYFKSNPLSNKEIFYHFQYINIQDTQAGSNKGNRLLGAWNTNNTGSTIPMLTTSNTADEGRASSYFVENGSYLKLRTLQLGYNVPSSFLSKFKMSNARIYVSGQNLLTIKSKSLTCPDPENPDWNYPLATSVSFGLQIGF